MIFVDQLFNWQKNKEKFEKLFFKNRFPENKHKFVLTPQYNPASTTRLSMQN
jgi:hypothetical protein